MPEGRVTIKPGREKPIRNRHPWIFSGAIARAERAVDGELVTILDHKGRFLARGYWNSRSQIQVRILSWNDLPIDGDWWRQILTRAFRARAHLRQAQNDVGAAAYRLVNAENDFAPGLVIDCYGDWAVIQAQTLYIDQHKHILAGIMKEEFGWENVYERSDIDARRAEGLASAQGLLMGKSPPETIPIAELANYHVDIQRGQKTGFYLDQRSNRRILHDLIQREYSAPTDAVNLLNLFSYSGGFAFAALKCGNVRAINVDSSRAALELAERNEALNGFDNPQSCSKSEYILADAFEYLRYCQDENQRFDIIVVDPPKFAHHKGQIARATRGYKDLNLQAFKLIKPGGQMMTFSCSGAISRDLFHKVVFAASLDAGREAQVIQVLSAAEDHPVALTFPEGQYLKGLLLRVN